MVPTTVSLRFCPVDVRDVVQDPHDLGLATGGPSTIISVDLVAFVVPNKGVRLWNRL